MLWKSRLTQPSSAGRHTIGIKNNNDNKSLYNIKYRVVQSV
jgi:hypothetical protein